MIQMTCLPIEAPEPPDCDYFEIPAGHRKQRPYPSSFRALPEQRSLEWLSGMKNFQFTPGNNYMAIVWSAEEGTPKCLMDGITAGGFTRESAEILHYKHASCSTRVSMNGKLLTIRLYIAAILLLCSCSAYMFEPDCYGQKASSTVAGSDDTTAQSSSTPAVGKPIVGKAPWDGPGFAGRKTANGERFDPNKPTAAAKQLPLGSHAVITNLDNGRSVKVRVNDCRPVPKGRKVDLSKKAAQRLHMTHDGTAPVKIKVVDVPPDATACDGKIHRSN